MSRSSVTKSDRIITNWIVKPDDQRHAGGPGNAAAHSRSLADLVHMAAELCGADFAALALFDGERCEYAATYGPSMELPKCWSRLDAGVPGALLIADTKADSRTAALADDPESLPGRFFAAAPVLVDGKLRGRLLVFAHEPRDQPVRIEWALLAVARQIAVQFEVHGVRSELQSVMDALHRGEQLLEAVVEKYRTLMECMADGVFVASGESVLFSNRALLDMLGYANDRLLTQGTATFVAEESLTVWRDRCQRAQQGIAADTDAVQVKLRCAGGAELWSELRVRPVVYEGQAAVVGIVRNIAEQRRAEDALRESENRFRVLADHAPVLVWMAEVDQSYSYVSQPWLKFTGRNSAQELGEGWLQGVHPDDVANTRATYAAAFAARQSFEVEFRLRRWDGAYGWMLCRGAPRLRANGEVNDYIGTAMEITQRKEAEHELRESHEKLRALLRRLDAAVEAERVRIAREIHDELGQALTGLGYDLAGMRSRLEPVRDEPARLALQERLDRMAVVVDQTIAQMRRIATELRPPLLDQLGLVAALTAYVSQFQERTTIRCDLQVDQQIALAPERAVGVFRIAQEALTNVSRHAEATRVNFSLTEHNRTLTMEVRDNGRGIPNHQLIAPDSIGLVGMQERARALGGTLSIDSRTGQGTRLWLQLATDNLPAAGNRARQFLVVDDHPIVRRGIKQILSEAYPTAVLHEAADAAGLFEKVRTQTLDLVVLDLSLPDKSGLECVPEIHRLRPDLPVLMLSMFSDTQFAVPALKAGTRGYVNKERAPQELVVAVEKILNGGKHVNTDFAEGLLHDIIDGAVKLNGDARLPHERLSAREIQVMQGLTRGMTISQIGKEMGISVKTASTYRTRILEKLGLRANNEIVQYCLEHGYVKEAGAAASLS